MNVTVESLAQCKKMIRLEIDAKEVDAEFETLIKDYQRQAGLPGFRPGKAPRDMVAKRFEKEIQDEVRRKLIPKAYKEAVETQNLDVVAQLDLEEIQFGRGQGLQLAITVETAPEFALPEYKGLPAKRETSQVTDEDLEKALGILREREAKLEPVARPLQTGDVAVVNYTGTSEGRPLVEIDPGAKSLSERKGFWIPTDGAPFIPGFAEQLLGASAGEKRTVTIDLPADFASPQLAGKKAIFEVELVEVREKQLPPLDEAYAKNMGAESVEKLRAGIRTDLENELNFKKDRGVRNQLVNALLNSVNFELPESSVAHETRNVVFNIVQENKQRGVDRDMIEQQKDAIYSVANNSAKARVKANFLLRKIAEKEDIKVSQEEVIQRIQHLAGLYQIPPEKFIEDLKKRNGVIEIYDQLSFEKTLGFLQEHAKIEDVPPGSLDQPPAAAPPA